MKRVAWEDIQGLVRSGYPMLPHSAYLLWRIIPGKTVEARQWLGDLADRLTRVGDVAEFDRAGGHTTNGPQKGPAKKPPNNLKALKHALKLQRHAEEACAINIALTAVGLKALGVDGESLTTFAPAFLEGMVGAGDGGNATTRRSSMLGDVGDNAPDTWLWGGPGGQPIAGALLLYATTRAALEILVAREMKEMSGALEPILRTSINTADPVVLHGWIERGKLREHFGFRDGISQPIIEGTAQARTASAKERRISEVRAGEIVLGYANERGAITNSPLLRNGTYLVLRQLEQDVEAFNTYLSTAAVRLGGADDEATREWVAARLIGRWRSGAPLVPAAADATTDEDVRNDFLYNYEDPSGLACPIGAHIRRANPRDSLGPNPETALRLSKMHRIIRRSRLYGTSSRPDAGGRAENSQETKRGLFFLCLNADIAGQFEMIQHNWMNNIHYNSLYDETDPINHDRAGDAMTIQSRPTNLRLTGMPRFVRVRGGGYFFLPGIKAIRSLARPDNR